MHCHISWHVALFALMVGDSERWPGQTYEAQVHPWRRLGAALNGRHRCAGRSCGAPSWPGTRGENRCGARRADYRVKSFPRPALPSSTCTAPWLASPPATVRALPASCPELEQRAASGRSPAGDVVPPTGGWPPRPTAAATGPAAITALEPALAETVRIGGSRAQRDADREHIAGGISQGRPRHRCAQVGRGPRRAAALGYRSPASCDHSAAVTRGTPGPASSTVSWTSVWPSVGFGAPATVALLADHAYAFVSVRFDRSLGRSRCQNCPAPARLHRPRRHRAWQRSLAALERSHEGNRRPTRFQKVLIGLSRAERSTGSDVVARDATDRGSGLRDRWVDEYPGKRGKNDQRQEINAFISPAPRRTNVRMASNTRTVPDTVSSAQQGCTLVSLDVDRRARVVSGLRRSTSEAEV